MRRLLTYIVGLLVGVALLLDSQELPLYLVGIGSHLAEYAEHQEHK